ncbi:unnamed protein product [Dovyalis caffra]|uniref:Uncharacterized protein n=1 Tax=Dovyalis caffra TaxID=77055 RepID=A0AAV1SHK8_9ROSI|nr:unnamed protein product [Dovyalis caffra]
MHEMLPRPAERYRKQYVKGSMEDESGPKLRSISEMATAEDYVDWFLFLSSPDEASDSTLQQLAHFSWLTPHRHVYPSVDNPKKDMKPKYLWIQCIVP